MFKNSKAFSGFSVDDIDKAQTFYSDILGLTVNKNEMGILSVETNGNNPFIIYPKGNSHKPASFTILNFPVEDIEIAVDELTKKGITFEKYKGTDMETDEKGIFRKGGPLAAWFADPAGNILSIIQNQ